MAAEELTPENCEKFYRHKGGTHDWGAQPRRKYTDVPATLEKEACDWTIAGIEDENEEDIARLKSQYSTLCDSDVPDSCLNIFRDYIIKCVDKLNEADGTYHNVATHHGNLCDVAIHFGWDLGAFTLTNEGICVNWDGIPSSLLAYWSLIVYCENFGINPFNDDVFNVLDKVVTYRNATSERMRKIGEWRPHRAGMYSREYHAGTRTLAILAKARVI